ncbi:MAG: M20/M25/M40 family metallo-hydrolase [Lactobacillus sp.]|jgi:acetylornithine deacetylase/succinyl-diaminopimelate desuccinylase-like protein|nr:M20/M25/M40 family metallo-hydrolase [Lactobacillus sp.]MCI2032004.1 M20/M25/M40 family metallo-hydrolase [Lactobacillus sp.]
MSRRTEVEQFAVDYLPELEDYLRIPTISAQNKGIRQTVEWVKAAFTALDADIVDEWHDQGGNPVVYAEFKGQQDKTILFYNHYDVQPPEPLAEWHTEPFEPTVVNGELIARGVADDKGELMYRLTTLRWLKDHGGFPVNMKFFVEGEEEIGSPHVGQYVQAHAAELAADACIWETGGKNEAEHFQITAGMKGIVSFDLSVQTAAADIHSSLGTYVDNAAWRLVQALASLRDAENHIHIDGFYDDIQPLDDASQAAIAAMDFDGEAIKKTYGLKRPFITDQPKEAAATAPSLTINGLSSGYEGEGLKTIVPKSALAKLDCRLVPGQEPRKIAALIQKQLEKNGFADVRLHYNLGEDAFHSDLNDPHLQIAKAVGEEVYGETAVRFVPMMPGGGPAKFFADALQLPIIAVGVTYAGSGPHAPNESVRVADYQQGTYYLLRLLEEFAR